MWGAEQRSGVDLIPISASPWLLGLCGTCYWYWYWYWYGRLFLLYSTHPNRIQCSKDNCNNGYSRARTWVRKWRVWNLNSARIDYNYKTKYSLTLESSWKASYESNHLISKGDGDFKIPIRHTWIRYHIISRDQFSSNFKIFADTPLPPTLETKAELYHPKWRNS